MIKEGLNLTRTGVLRGSRESYRPVDGANRRGQWANKINELERQGAGNEVNFILRIEEGPRIGWRNRKSRNYLLPVWERRLLLTTSKSFECLILWRRFYEWQCKWFTRILAWAKRINQSFALVILASYVVQKSIQITCEILPYVGLNTACIVCRRTNNTISRR